MNNYILVIKWKHIQCVNKQRIFGQSKQKQEVSVADDHDDGYELWSDTADGRWKMMMTNGTDGWGISVSVKTLWDVRVMPSTWKKMIEKRIKRRGWWWWW